MDKAIGLGEYLYQNGAKASREGCRRAAAEMLARADWTLPEMERYLWVSGLVANRKSALPVALGVFEQMAASRG